MKRFLLTLLIAFPVLVMAQSNFHKGYVVTNSKDTLKGFIDFRERRKNPVSVDFRTDMNGKTQTFSLLNCAAYGLYELEHYARFIVNVSMNKTDIADLSIGRDTSFKRDTVFLKVLQTGKNLTLFSYVDGLKERFYIRETDDAEPLELIRDLYLKEVGGNLVVIDNKYTRQLLIEMRKFRPGNFRAEEHLMNVRYNEVALNKVVGIINDQQPAKSPYPGIRFMAGAGLNASTASYTGQHVLASRSAKSKTSYLPMLSTGLDVFIKPTIGKYIWRTTLSVLMNKSEVAVAADENNLIAQRYSFDQVSVMLSPQFICNLYNTNALKCFTGLGVGLNFSSISNTRYTYVNPANEQVRSADNEIGLEKFNYSAQLMAGVVLNKRIEVLASYSPPVAISNYTFFNVKMQRFSLGLNYLFGKH